MKEQKNTLSAVRLDDFIAHCFFDEEGNTLPDEQAISKIFRWALFEVASDKATHAQHEVTQ